MPPQVFAQEGQMNEWMADFRQNLDVKGQVSYA